MAYSSSTSPTDGDVVVLTGMTVPNSSHDEVKTATEEAQLGLNDTVGQLATDDTDHQREFSLPRADGGKEAWLFLAGCCTVEALVWGECLWPSSGANPSLHAVKSII